MSTQGDKAGLAMARIAANSPLARPSKHLGRSPTAVANNHDAEKEQ
jgi:hypothetical protein